MIYGEHHDILINSNLWFCSGVNQCSSLILSSALISDMLPSFVNSFTNPIVVEVQSNIGGGIAGGHAPYPLIPKGAIIFCPK